MKISLTEIDAIKADLAKLQPPLNAVREMPIKEVILALAPELQAMVGRGYTTDGLLEELKKRKINITGRSLNSYLKEFKKSRKCTNDAAAPVERSVAPVPPKRHKDENRVTPGEEKEAAPSAPEPSTDESWREQFKDFV